MVYGLRRFSKFYVSMVLVIEDKLNQEINSFLEQRKLTKVASKV